MCHTADEMVIARQGAAWLMKCQECEVRHVWPIPTQQELDARFATFYQSVLGKLPVMFEKSREPVLERIARFIQTKKPGGAILDIGCGNGYFLARLFNGPNWRRFGIEVCPETAEQAEAAGVHTTVGSLADAALPAGAFDVVVILDTFFYLPDPRAAVREVMRLLAPKGTVVIEVPSAATRLIRAGANQNRLDLFYYPAKALVRLLRDAGFRIDAVLPLPANRQQGILRNAVYSIYSALAQALFYLSLGRIVAALRFAVAASSPLPVRSD